MTCGIRGAHGLNYSAQFKSNFRGSYGVHRARLSVYPPIHVLSSSYRFSTKIQFAPFLPGNSSDAQAFSYILSRVHFQCNVIFPIIVLIIIFFFSFRARRMSFRCTADAIANPDTKGNLRFNISWESRGNAIRASIGARQGQLESSRLGILFPGIPSPLTRSFVQFTSRSCPRNDSVIIVQVSAAFASSR